MIPTLNYLTGVVAASKPDGGGGSWSLTDGHITFPEGTPAPVVWLSPRFVEYSGSYVTKMLNQAPTGPSFDAANEYNGGNGLVLDAPNRWNGRDVFALGNNFSRYATVNPFIARTVFVVAGYRGRGFPSFETYSGLISYHTLSLTADPGDLTFNPVADQTVYVDGDPESPSNPVLPLVKGVIAASRPATNPAKPYLLVDRSRSSGAEWPGPVGDIMFFEELLSPEQIKTISDTLYAYYADPPELFTASANNSVAFGRPAGTASSTSSRTYVVLET